MRPPLATSHTDTPPQCLTLGLTGVAVLQSACGTRSATWALSRATNRGDRLFAMFVLVLTWTQNLLAGPVTTLVQAEPRNCPTRARKRGLSK
jgi:hypothetical protein